MTSDNGKIALWQIRSCEKTMNENSLKIEGDSEWIFNKVGEP